MKGFGKTSPFHPFTNPQHDKSVYFWSWGSYLLCMSIGRSSSLISECRIYVCFEVLRPGQQIKVMLSRSVNLSILFLGRLPKQLTSTIPSK